MKLTKTRLKEIVREEIQNLKEATPRDRASVVGLSGNTDLVIPKNQMSKAKSQYKKMMNYLNRAGKSMTQPGEIDTMVMHMESAYDEMLALWKNVKEVKKESIKEEKLNEVDFSKIKLPSVVDRFLNKFVDAMKGANLNRMKRAAILYKVIDAAGMTPQQLMADIQKIKQAMK